MKELLYKKFSDIYPITEQGFNFILQNFKTESYKKGEKILKLGQIEKRTSFILNGIIEENIILDDVNFTVDIYLKGMCYNDLRSYLSEVPSLKTRTAITDVDIVYIEKEAAEKLRYESHAYCYIYSKFRENDHLEREKRSYMLQNNNALKRFELFMETNANAKKLLEKVPQYIVAKYLNLTPETFSRVKKEYFKN